MATTILPIFVAIAGNKLSQLIKKEYIRANLNAYEKQFLLIGAVKAYKTYKKQILFLNILTILLYILYMLSTLVVFLIILSLTLFINVHSHLLKKDVQECSEFAKKVIEKK